MSNGTGIGHFVSWDGGCLVVGRAKSIVPVHAHYAIQIAFGSQPGIRFRSSEWEAWTEYGGAIIPSRQPHTMDATVVPFNVVMFIEPETREGRALSEIYLRDGIASLPDDKLAGVVPELFAAWQERTDGAGRDRCSARSRTRAHGRSRTGGRLGPADSARDLLHQESPRLRADARGRSGRGIPVPESLPPSLRGGDGDGAPAVHPVATLCARLGAAYGRGFAIDRGARRRIR